MVADLAGLDPAPRAPLSVPGAIGWTDWQRIDAAEVARGKDRGKLREKFVRVAEMLAAVDRA